MSVADELGNTGERKKGKKGEREKERERGRGEEGWKDPAPVIGICTYGHKAQ